MSLLKCFLSIGTVTSATMDGENPPDSPAEQLRRPFELFCALPGQELAAY